MSSKFNADEILSQLGKTQTSVYLWRTGWGDKETFDTLHEALRFVRADKSDPVKLEVHVHTSGDGWIFDGDNLNALVARGGDKNDPGGYGNGGTGDGGG